MDCGLVMSYLPTGTRIFIEWLSWLRLKEHNNVYFVIFLIIFLRRKVTIHIHFQYMSPFLTRSLNAVKMYPSKIVSSKSVGSTI